MDAALGQWVAQRRATVDGESIKTVHAFALELRRINSLKRFTKSRFSSEDINGRRLTLGLLLLISATLIFTAIAVDVTTGERLTILDVRLSNWLQHHSVASLTKVMRLVSWVHSLTVLAVVNLALCIYLWIRGLWIRGLRIWALRLVLAVFGGMLLNLILKYVFVRQRPQIASPLLELTTYSFPSGHTVVATVFYGTLAMIIISRVRKLSWRVLALAVAGLMIVLVAFSRIYLGAHYLSDVLGGFAEGVAWLAFCQLAMMELERRTTQPQS